MGLYKAGIARGMVRTVPRLSPYRRGISVGALVFTPGMARDMIRKLNSEILTTDKEMTNQLSRLECKPTRIAPTQSDECVRLYDYWSGPWSTFEREWEEFMAAHDTWHENLWGATWDAINGMRRRFIALRKAAKDVGYEFASPDPEDPESSVYQDAAKKIGGWFDTLKWVLIGALVVGGVLLLVYFFQGHSVTLLSGAK